MRSTPPIPRTLPQAAGLIARLAWPTMLSRFGVLLMGFVDIVMVGRYATEELAYAALGYSLFMPALVTVIGLQVGVLPLVARAYGAGNHFQCGIEWRRGLPWAFASGVAAAVFTGFSGVLLAVIGHEPHLAREAGRVALAVAWGLPLQIVYVVCAFYLEATRRPIPGFVFMVLANLLNVLLNWVLIYGNAGFEAMGAVGSGYASSVVRVFLIAAIMIYILTRPDARAYGVFERAGSWWGKGGWRAGREMRRIGIATAFSYFAETGAFAVVMQFAGFMGAAAIAAYSIAHNLLAMLFMLGLGIASATAVLVGNADGQDSRHGASLSGWTGIGGAIAVMAVLGLLIALLAWPLARLYTSDPELVARTVPLLLIVALFCPADGSQVVASQAVRGLGDSWRATNMHFVAWIAVFIPVAWLLGFPAGMREAGLLVAGGIGAVVALMLMSLRFNELLRRIPALPATP